MGLIRNGQIEVVLRKDSDPTAFYAILNASLSGAAADPFDGDLQSMLTIAENGLDNQLTDVEFNPGLNGTLNNVPVLNANYTFTNLNGDPANGNVAVFIHNDQAFIINFNSANDTFGDTNTEVSTITKTFQFTG